MTKVLYQQAQLPVLQNRVYDTAREAQTCVVGDVKLVEDQETGLVYNAAFDPSLITYDGHYNNEQALSPVFQEHLLDVSLLIERLIGSEDLVEVGCGKGFFLEMMIKRGAVITGFDPAYTGDNPRVVKKYFEPGLIGGRTKGLILRHVLEHINEPVQFLARLRDANGGAGLIYIEVPCFDWICAKRAWFDVFYEHVNYFRLCDFERIFGKIVDCGHIFGGQYLYIVADLASLRTPRYSRDHAVQFPENFNGPDEAVQVARADKVGVWGAGSKGVIFAMMQLRQGTDIDLVIDINPEKQGKFLPVTGLKVYSPESGLRLLPKGSTIFVMNSIYLNEIQKIAGPRYNFVGIDQ